MEDVLDLYHEGYDPERPVVCMDESSKQLVKEVRTPLPLSPKQPVRIDSEYERNGTANIFMFFEPLAGWRRVDVTDQRTKIDWAHQIKKLLDIDYPNANVVRLVMDNLNTHCIGSLYDAFPAREARRLAERLEIHYTPKHGSWLNMAEIELHALSVQCLDRRIGEKSEMAREVKAWERDRNEPATPADWQFRTEDARIHLKRLYPNI